MNPFEGFDVAYVDQPYWTFLSAKDGTIDYEFFEQFRGKLVVINFSSEHWNGADIDVYNRLSQSDINFLLLTYNHQQHLQQPRMIYYPWWYHWATKPGHKWKEYSHLAVDNKNKGNLIGWLGGTPRPHKILSFLKLRDKPYWKDTIWTFYYPEDFIAGRAYDLELTQDEIDQWNMLKSSLLPRPPETMTSPRKFGYWDLDIPQLHNVYLHLLSETAAMPQVFTSEKIWKPLAMAVPFVVWGSFETMSFLKSHGFDIYDDVIDHKYYDSESDPRIRLEKLLQVIDDLITQGVDKVYNQLHQRAVVNQTRFFDKKWSQNYTDDLTQAINKYT